MKLTYFKKFKIKEVIRSFFVEIVTILTIPVALVALMIASFLSERPLSEAPIYYVGSLIVVGGIWVALVISAYRRIK